MDWMYVAPKDSSHEVPQLGFYVGDKYKVASDAVATLESTCRKLQEEDKTLRTFRRKLGFLQIAQKDIGPMLIESGCEEAFEVFSSAIKLMVDLTTPLECLFATTVERSEEGAQTCFELKQQLSDTKNVFMDPRVSRSVLGQVERLLNVPSERLKDPDRMFLINCVTLLRNVLHIPETGSSSPDSTETTTSGGDANSGDGEVDANRYSIK